MTASQVADWSPEVQCQSKRTFLIFLLKRKLVEFDLSVTHTLFAVDYGVGVASAMQLLTWQRLPNHRMLR